MAGPELVLLVPHPTRLAVLTTVDGAALPTVTAPGPRTVEQFDAIAERLGSLPPVLRKAVGRMTEDGDATLLLVDLETIGPDAPPGLAWTDTADLDLATAVVPELRGATERAIARYRDGPGPLDPPWIRPGWFARASSWMTEQMTALGRPATTPPRIFYLWSISMVIRAESAAGPMYLKASTPLFDGEAAVTAALARATPDLVTRVAAVEPTEGWLLMDDHGDDHLGDAPPERWVEGLEVHATIQRHWATRNDELARTGAAVRPLSELVAALPGFADRLALAGAFSADDLRIWDAALPGFVESCRRLDALGPVPTLVHGDFHPWNVADGPDGARVFDWTDAAISHPFTDLAVYVTRTKDVGLRRTMRDAYLARWAADMDPAHLAEAGDLAIVVGTLYQVDSYLQIVESLGPDDIWDLGMATGSWARAAIEAQRAGIALVRTGHADG